jgi:hypothetical protein
LHTSPITIGILREAFEVYGPIKKIIRRGKYPNGNIRAAKIYFESRENAEEARNHLDGMPLYGAYLKVSHGSKPPKSARRNDVRVPSEQVAVVPIQGKKNFNFLFNTFILIYLESDYGCNL